jgi:CBS domain-containing protein
LPLFPVVRDADMLAGCVTTDMVRALPRDEWPRHTVQEITKSCSAENTITPDMDAADALSRMSRANMARLMVVDGGRLLGIVALKDLLEFFSTKMELEGRGPRREVIV